MRRWNVANVTSLTGSPVILSAWESTSGGQRSVPSPLPQRLDRPVVGAEMMVDGLKRYIEKRLERVERTFLSAHIHQNETSESCVRHAAMRATPCRGDRPVASII